MSMVWYTGSDGTGALTTGSVNTTYYAKLSFKGEDVRAVYIDWGDGTSSKKTEANYQWAQYTEPKSSDIISHIYTQSGTFTPIVQTVNSQGIVSRYYGSGATAEVKPYTVDTNINHAIIKDSTATGVMRVENTTVKSGIDNSVFEKMGPSKLFMYIPPTLTKDELESLGSIKLTLELMMSDSVMNTGSTSATYNLNKVGGGTSLQTLQASVLVSGGSAIQNGIFNLLLSGGSGAVPLNGDYSARCTRVVSVRFDNCKIEDATYNQNDLFNRLKIFILTEGMWLSDSNQDYDESALTYYPVCYVSAGSPYKSVDEPQRNVMLDFSQSRAAASNISIDSYRFDLGKTWLSPMYRWNVTGTSATRRFSDVTKVTKSTIPVAYTYMPRLSVTKNMDTRTASYTTGGGSNNFYAYGLGGLNNRGSIFLGSAPNSNSYLTGCFLDDEFNYWYISTQGRYRDTAGGAATATGKANQYITSQFGLDDFGKFYDQYHFVRNTADPATTGSDGSTLNVSPMVQNQPEVIKIYGANTNWTTEAGPTKISSLAYAVSGSVTATSMMYYNSGNLLSGNNQQTAPLSLTNNILPKDISGATVSGNVDYFLLIMDAKTNKLFLNCSNYAQLVTDTDATYPGDMTRLTIAGVSYLRVNNPNTFEQTAEWIPVEFNDETRVEREYRDTTNDKYYTSGASFARSGYLSFDMPDDWSTSTITQLCGGRFDTNNSTAWTGSLNSMEKAITGNLDRMGNDTTNVGSLAQWGYSFKINNVGSAFDDKQPEDIGAFKYIVQLTDGGTGGSTGNNSDMVGVSRWVARTDSGVVKPGFNGLDSGGSDIYFHDGRGTLNASKGWDDGASDTKWIMRPVNLYDVIDGISKVYYVSGTDANLMPQMAADQGGVDGYDLIYDNTYSLDGAGKDAYFGTANCKWATEDKYVLKIAVSGVTGITDNDGYYSDSADNGLYPEWWNVFDATQNNVGIIKQVDDSAWNLNSLPITSDISLSRSSTMYTAITRKGKVYIAKTGIGLQTISFSSVALGDSRSSTAFDSSTNDTMYGQLRMIRKLQSSSGEVYWDEPQKDGTYIRLFGVITNIGETLGTGGSRSVLSYNFNVTIDRIALLDANGIMMTNPYPLGGIENERSYK